MALGFAGGEQLTLPDLLAVDAYAGHQLAYGLQGTGREWKPDDGVGLVGLSNNGDYYDYGPCAVRRLWLQRAGNSLSTAAAILGV